MKLNIQKQREKVERLGEDLRESIGPHSDEQLIEYENEVKKLREVEDESK